MKNNIEFAEINNSSINLFKQTKEQFAKSENEVIKAKTAEVPTQFVDNDKKINIVFAGQYSAGKSTIISLMTGQKLETGQGVTTQQCKTLEWNDVHITDTPGVFTQKRPDHDEITIDAVSKADLIVFVMTGEGFSPNLGEHFRELLIGQGKGHEMLLVVNKMESTPMGNTKEQQEIFIKENLLPVIAPNFSPDDLYISFVDAESFQDAMLESDEEEKKYLIETSGIQNFYDNVNRFIKDKDFLGRCTSSLYRNEQLLSDATAEFKTGDLCVDGAIYLLNKQRGILTESRENIKNQAYNLVRKHTHNVVKWGSDIANSLTEDCNADAINSEIHNKYNEVDNIYSNAAKDLEDIIGKENERLSEQINQLANTSFAKDFKAVVDRKMAEMNVDPAKAQAVTKGATYVKDFGTWISKMSTGANAGSGWSAIFKLGTYSGSNTHKAVLTVGHFFGHKFKPWEAVKITGKIGQVGKFLGIAGAVVGVVTQIISDKQEEKAERQLREARCNIRNSFSDAADAINMEFDKNTQMWVEENYNSKIAEIDSNINELKNLVKSKTKEYDEYQSLLKRTRNLIERIHEIA